MKCTARACGLLAQGRWAGGGLRFLAPRAGTVTRPDPPDGSGAAQTFSAVKKYGLQLQVTNDPGLTEYLGSVLKQLSEWLLEGKLQKLVLVIAKLDGGEIIERWAFDVQTDQVRGPLAPQRLACKRSPSGNA